YQFGVVTRRRFVSSHYHCLFICKDDKERKFYPFARFTKEDRDKNGRSLHYRDKEDVWTIKREYWTGDHKTPTKLPRELIEKILNYSSTEGDVVCDPFIGSGQVAVIAKAMKRHFVGFEINKEYYDFAKARLDSGQYRLKVTRQGNLF
ncbi:MAG: site-specific DNA-methyltransferase, partial [Candidatus Marinimicrobia bacterium]|nr:site-specific DNA-methyltransferase [Candidatus Neomarinimicrobiota bacterium]